jgi:CheY-like chemotaxis protein
VVAEAAGGEEGLALARRLKPALILLDLNMPGADGAHVLAELQADETTAEIPVAAVTSLAPVPEQDARLAHARAIFAKNELSPAAIRRVLEEAVIGTQTAKS